MAKQNKSEKYRSVKTHIQVTPRTDGQKQYIEMIRSKDLTICSGPAGSGKSLVAVGMALSLYKESQGKYKKIIVARPAITACDEDLGYLPGGIDEKMSPFVAPIENCLSFYLNHGEIDGLFDTGVISVIPIAYMRGLTFNDSIVIFDEAQNSTPSQMKLFLTRLGFNCKAIVEGDITQCDLPINERAQNGLRDAMTRLRNVPGVGLVQLEATDVVRSELVSRILEKYD